MIYSISKQKIIFIIWIISLLIIFYSIYNIHNEFNKAISNRFEEHQKDLTYIVASQIQTYIFNRSIDFKALAKTISYENNNKKNIQNDINECFNFVKNHYATELQFIDANRKVKFSTDSSKIGQNFSSNSLYNWCRNSSNYQQIKLSTSDDSNLTLNKLTHYLKIITPVYASSNSIHPLNKKLKFQGLLVLKVNLDSLLNENIYKLSLLAKKTEFMIVDNNGLIISPNYNKHPQFSSTNLNSNSCITCHPAYPVGIDSEKNFPYNPFIINESVLLQTKNNGKKIVTFYNIELPGTKWLLITSGSFSLMKAIENNAQLKFSFLFLLITSIFIAGSMIIYRNYIRKEKAEEEVQRLIEKHKLETELMESEKRYKLVVEKSPLPIILHESQSIFYVNDSCVDLFGAKNKDEIIGKPFNLFFTGTKKILDGRKEDKPSTDIKELPYEQKLLRIDGSILDVEITEMDFIFNGKSVMLAICADITSKKKEEEAMLKYNKELEDLHSKKNFLFSIIAQDLKSPFQSLIGYTDLLANELDALDENEIRMFSIALNKNAKIYFNLLEGLLSWATIQTQSENFSPKELELLTIVNDAINILEHNASQKGVQLLNEIPAGLLVKADSDMLSIILRNLISNSIKFSYPTGKIKIIVSYSDDKVAICIVDNGRGIQEEYLKDLFKFEKIYSSSGTRGEKGTGLGLTICKDLVEKHGGSLWAISKPDVETSFIFTLPKI